MASTTRTLLFLAAVGLVLAVAHAYGTTTVVAPSAGPITGLVTDKSRQFLGVPFAQPPVGDLRWKAPQMADKFSTPFKALADGPGCPQVCTLPPGGCPPIMSEDCLLMNIYTPLGASAGDNLPVMIFIHGGQFHAGYAGTLLYDGENFVNNTNVVMAVIQYRLGALGFLYTGDDISGNYGLLDQKLAIEWVIDNIASFGGNPKLITVFGQSAGAMSIGSHLASPAFKGLYQRALLESEPFGIPFRDQDTWGPFAKDYAKHVGCDTTGNFDACLRAASWETLAAAQPKARVDLLADLSNLFQVFVPWTPTVGTELLPEPPLEAWSQGNVHDIPILAGTVENEGVAFVYAAFGKPISKIEYDLALGLIFGIDDGIAIGLQYPDGKAPDARKEMALVATRSLFRCTTRNATLGVTGAADRKSPVYNYVFDHVASFSQKLWGQNYSFCWDSVCHAEELAFVFAPNGTSHGIVFDAEEVVMTSAIQTWWSNFARTGHPGTANGIEWPTYSAKQRNLVRIETPANIIQDDSLGFCDFWDSIGYAWALPQK